MQLPPDVCPTIVMAAATGEAPPPLAVAKKSPGLGNSPARRLSTDGNDESGARRTVNTHKLDGADGTAALSDEMRRELSFHKPGTKPEEKENRKSSRRTSSISSMVRVPVQSFIKTSSNHSQMEEFLEDPIASSFLRSFCIDGHTQENMFFCLDVDAFVDLIVVQNLGKEQIRVEAQKIYETYIHMDATLQICLDDFAQRDLDKKFKEGGDDIDKDIFVDAREAACFTINTDVLPRYTDSDLYQEFKTKVDGCIPPIAGINPDLSMFDLLREVVDMDTWKPDFSLDDVMGDRIMYPYFEKHLKAKCVESCCVLVRLIAIFEAHRQSDDMQEARNMAWTILCNFLHEESPSKIEFTNPRLWRSVCMTIASPKEAIFNTLSDQAVPHLQKQYDEFKTSEDYEILCGVMTAELKKRNSDIKANTHVKKNRRGSKVGKETVGFIITSCKQSSVKGFGWMKKGDSHTSPKGENSLRTSFSNKNGKQKVMPGGPRDPGEQGSKSKSFTMGTLSGGMDKGEEDNSASVVRDDGSGTSGAKNKNFIVGFFSNKVKSSKKFDSVKSGRRTSGFSNSKRDPEPLDDGQ